MNKPMRIAHPLCKIADDAVIDLPSPSNISIWWILGLRLVIQVDPGMLFSTTLLSKHWIIL